MNMKLLEKGRQLSAASRPYASVVWKSRAVEGLEPSLTSKFCTLLPQNFARVKRYSTDMGKTPHPSEILAKNLRFFMARPECQYRNPNALGKASQVAPNSVRNLLNPKKRTVTTEKPDGYPQLDTVAKLANKLGAEVWELLHPDIEKSLREREMYKKVEADFKSLGKDAPHRLKLPAQEEQ